MGIHALRNLLTAALAVLAMALALVPWPGATGGIGQAPPAQPALAQPPVVQVADVAPAPLDAAELLEEVSPALVDIDTITGSDESRTGTGIVLTPRGLVLTNAHVVASAVEVRATDVGDGYTYPAQLVGADPEHDIALIQLTGAAHLHTATLGDSDTVRVGDQVASIGDAGGLGRMSIGAGAVTHLHRSLSIATTAGPDPETEPLAGLIEARTWIRPGQSGGPMVTPDAKVIGVNVAYTNPRDGFAIPINDAIDAAHEILANNSR